MEISDDPFAGDRYIIQGGVGTALAFFGVSTPSYRVFDEQGRLVLAAEVPALSAREIVLYADRDAASSRVPSRTARRLPRQVISLRKSPQAQAQARRRSASGASRMKEEKPDVI